MISIKDAEQIFRLGMMAFPESSVVHVAYVRFANFFFVKDETKSVSVLSMVEENLHYVGLEESFWVYSLKRKIENERQNSLLGGNSKQVNALSLAEFQQQQMITFKLHEATISEILKLWKS